MDKLSSSDESDKGDRPSPRDFDIFLPWACYQLQIEMRIEITRVEQEQYTNPFTSARFKKPVRGKDESEQAVARNSDLLNLAASGQAVNIHTVYDHNDNLVQLKFLKNAKVPRGVLQIIALVTSFHQRLTMIKIDGGVKKDGIYEISNILSLSKVTEVILDNNVLEEANYYILLNDTNSLKYLSLARCKINDTAVKLIAARLSTCGLSILNLTSNRITDIGATHLGIALRFNRKLTYLNLADNMITDAGAEIILNCLTPFLLSPDEITDKKARYMAYLRNKHNMTLKIYDELRVTDVDKKVAVIKKKAVKPSLISGIKKSKGIVKESFVKEQQAITVTPEANTSLLEKAADSAKSSLGVFHDPFNAENTFTKDGLIYCLGNNILCYLSLAYNNLSYFTVKKLYEVVSAQESSGRLPKGLINVCIEGNNMPEACSEMTEIDFILQSGLATTKRVSMMRRRQPAKLNTR